MGGALDQRRGVVPPRPRLWLGPLCPAQADTGPAAAALSPLSAAERAWGEALPPARCRVYWQSRLQLRRWLALELGCEAAAVPLHSPPGRAPLLGDGLGWLSLSHSGDGLLLGLAAAPIGVDLEPADRPLAAGALMRRFFPPGEVAQLGHLAASEQRRAVLTSWVLKEAAIKWQRGTLAGDLAAWQFNHDTGRLHHRHDRLQPPGRSAEIGPWRWAAVGAEVEHLQITYQYGTEEHSC